MQRTLCGAMAAAYTAAKHRPCLPNLPFKAINFANFDLIVKTAFNQRRKTLSNSLKALVPNDVWNKVNIDPKLRPECLSIAEFVQLSNILEAKI